MKWLNRTATAAPYYTLCLTPAAYYRVLRHLKVPEKNWTPFVNKNPGATTHSYYLEHHLACIVCMAGYQGRDPVAVAGLLMHEAVHIWQHMCDAMGEGHPSAEFEAWSIQWIAQQLMWSFVSQTKAKR